MDLRHLRYFIAGAEDLRAFIEMAREIVGGTRRRRRDRASRRVVRL
ncbi:MAG TPA: hypothetical protein VFO18_15475 [Methylomirabilota bacterium]|nr:hypothetical protein [Methylomirabilota bacterium]